MFNILSIGLLYKYNILFNYNQLLCYNMKLCQIYNFAPHYRTEIYVKIAQTFDADFVFGNAVQDIKKANYELLDASVLETEIIYKYGIAYQKGILGQLKKPYDVYILTGEVRNISVWLFLLFAKFYSKKKVLLWSHGWYGKENWLERIIKKIFFKLPNGGILLYGNYAKDLMVKKGFDEKKLFVIHNSLAYSQHLALRKDVKESSIYADYFKNNNPNLIFVGRLTAVKKLEMVLEAMAINRKNGKEYNLTLIGGGERKESLEKLSIELGLQNNVWFYGPCYDENKLSELIYNGDLCVSPGNVGLTAIHSLVFGTPVLTHNNFPYQMPEFEAVREGETGTFFEYDNVQSLAECINEWFYRMSDRDDVREACMYEIDNYWTPSYQIEVLKKSLL